MEEASVIMAAAPEVRMAMEQVDMGRITVHAEIENLFDIAAVEEGRRSVEDIRRVEVDDALVDAGATLFSMPKELIDQLGLVKYSPRTVLSSGGPLEAGMYGAVRLTVQGRTCVIDVMEGPEAVPYSSGK
jgi:hypothetical protein